MLAFAIRRLFEALLVMLTVALLAFVLFRFVGDPVNQMVGQDTSLEDRLRLRQELGLDDPIVVQFARFLANAARFDFGISYQMKQPVTAIIAERAAGNVRARARGGPVRRRARHPDGRLYRHPPRQLAVEGVPDRLADRHLACRPS